MREYGIIHVRLPNELHRGPFSLRLAAELWIEEWTDDGGKPDVFEIVSREVSDWQVDRANGEGI
jgi:hypothetical protein